MNNIDKQYQKLLQDIIHFGVEKKDLTDTETISVFGRQIRHKMSEGFPLLTTKKMHWKSIVTKLLWFLRGDTNIKYLVDNGCHILDGDAYKAFCNERLEIHKKIVRGNPTCDFQPWEETISKEEFINKIKTDDEFAKKWGEPIYGKQWRSWGGDKEWKGKQPNPGFCLIPGIDQIANLISELKTNPDSRRLMVNAWNVGELDQMILPPCHWGFQVYTRELSTVERMEYYGKHYMKEGEAKSFDDLLKVDYVGLNIPTRAISLMYNTISQDVPLETPFNIASYALLLEIIAKEVNMIPEELIGNLGDCHIYLNQKEGVVEQLTREPYPLPKLKILDSKVDDIAHYEIGDFIIEGYQSQQEKVMNNEQQDLLNEAYENYCKSFENQTLIEQYSLDTDPMTQFMFLNKCKTNPEFSEKWGLKIEERELSLEERKIHMSKYSNDRIYPDWDEKFLNEKNIPTKLITITYNDKTITYYQEKLKKD
jgi:thymidylate synthase